MSPADPDGAGWSDRLPPNFRRSEIDIEGIIGRSGDQVIG
jgi:hypothetical protein